VPRAAGLPCLPWPRFLLNERDTTGEWLPEGTELETLARGTDEAAGRDEAATGEPAIEMEAATEALTGHCFESKGYVNENPLPVGMLVQQNDLFVADTTPPSCRHELLRSLCILEDFSMCTQTSPLGGLEGAPDGMTPLAALEGLLAAEIEGLVESLLAEMLKAGVNVLNQTTKVAGEFAAAVDS